tara:strand:- start:398 stop:820 length:423 start_codon:yes stop_codon:yes gene_type:complete
MSNYAGLDHEAPTVRLSRDEFTERRRELTNHPEAVAATSRIDVEDDYGNVTTWVLDLYRVGSDVTAFLQRGGNDGYIRLVLPPTVTSSINRHQSGLITKARRKTSRRVVADKRARGEKVGNPEALKKARKARKAKKATRR